MLSSIITSCIGLIVALSGGLSMANLGAAVANTSAFIGNEAPTIMSTVVAGHNTVSTANQRVLTISGVAQDLNHEADITTIALALYRDNGSNTPSCTADPNNCYHVPSCTLSYSYGNDTEVYYECFVTINRPYAFGAWKATVTATDQSAAQASATISFTITPLGDAGSGGGPFGSQPPSPTPPPVTPPQPPTPTPPSHGGTSTPPHVVTPSTPPSGDCVADFYNRIEKDEPSARGDINHTEGCNIPLIVAGDNTGLAIFDFSNEPTPTRNTTLGVIVEVPAGASPYWIIIYVDPISAEGFPTLTAVSTKQTLLAQASGLTLGERTGITPIGFTVFHVYARDNYGRDVPEISGAVRITLIVPQDLTGRKDLGLYRLDEIANTWVPQTFDENDDHTLTFRTSRLGFYALFDAQEIDQTGFPTYTFTYLSCFISIILLLLILLGLIILLIITIIRGDKKEEEEKQEENTETPKVVETTTETSTTLPETPQNP